MKTLICLLVITFNSMAYAFPCEGKNESIRCLRQNLNKCYSEDYKKFYDLYYKFEKAAKSCESVTETADFLRLATVINGNAEVSESYAESISKFASLKMECFLKSASTLKSNEIESLLYWLKSDLVEKGTATLIDEEMKKNEANRIFKKIALRYKAKTCCKRVL